MDILDFERIFYLKIYNSQFYSYDLCIMYHSAHDKLMTENLNFFLFRKKNKLNVYYTQNKK